MRRGGVAFIVAMLALTGCKGTGTKSPDKEAPGATASRGRDNTPAWLSDMSKRPGVPKADSWTDPKDPSFNATAEGKGVLGGRVLDPYNRGAKNVFIRIEPADITPAERQRGGAEVGITTDANGIFQAKGLKAGRPYVLTAEAQLEGKPIVGVIQTRPPQSALTIVLREDLDMPAPAGGTSNPASGGLPPPSSDMIPSTGAAPARPGDGAWSPNGVPATRPVPHTIGSPTPATPTPVPTVAPLPPPVDVKPATKPENIADGPKDPFRAPPASIPNGVPTPKLPPPTITPPPGAPQSRQVRPGANFALKDSMGRPCDFEALRNGNLVLLDFMTTTCVPCKKSIPTLTALQGTYGPSGLDVVGIVCDPVPLAQRVSLAERYQREQHLNYAMYTEDAAEQGRLFARYADANTGYPFAVLLDAEGNVLWKGHPGDRAALQGVIQRHIK